jgi:hypothetical protein
MVGIGELKASVSRRRDLLMHPMRRLGLKFSKPLKRLKIDGGSEEMGGTMRAPLFSGPTRKAGQRGRATAHLDRNGKLLQGKSGPLRGTEESIWVDITNLPHVLFFQDFISKFNAFVTARRHSSLTRLLEARGIAHFLAGRHGGAEAREKLLQSARRIQRLAEILPENIEVGVAKHSVELPRVAYGLGIPCLLVVDNEYAEHQNRLTLPLCTKILVPKALDHKRLIKQGAEKARITRFKGLCELAHLRHFSPADPGVEGDYVLVRPEPAHAAYFKEKDRTQELINALTEAGYRVVAMPRTEEGYKHALAPASLDSLSLIYHALVFIGGGGTMNRESALLGTPTISYYPQEPLGVDRFLIRKKLLVRGKIEEVPSLVEELADRKERLRKKAERLREAMEDPLKVLEREVSSLSGQSS